MTRARSQGGFCGGRQRQGGYVLIPYIVSALVSTAISMAVSWLFAPSIKGPRLKDLGATGQGYGPPIPRVYGTVSVSGSIVWASDLIEKKKKSGGKGGGGGSTTTYSYSQHVALAVCEGEANVLRIWAGGKLIWDATAGTSEKKIIPYANVVVHSGSETQGVSSLIESFEGVGTTPAYRGLCYVTLQNLQLAKFGNRLPPFQIEVSSSGLVPGTITDCGAVGDQSYRGEYLLFNTRKQKYLTITNQSYTHLNFYETDPQTHTTVLAAQYASTAQNNQFRSAYVPETNTIWVPMYTSNNILVFDADDYSLVQTINTGFLNNAGCVYFPDAGLVLAGRSNANQSYQKTYNINTYAQSSTTFSGNFATGGYQHITLLEGDAFVACDEIATSVAVWTLDASGVLTYRSNHDLSGSSGRQAAWDSLRKRVIFAYDSQSVALIQFDYAATPPMFGDKKQVDWSSGAMTTVATNTYDSPTTSKNIDSIAYNAAMDVYVAKAWKSSTTNTLYLLDPAALTYIYAATFYGPTTDGHLMLGQDNASVYTLCFGTDHLWRVDISQYGASVPLADVVSDLCTEAGLESSEYDVTDLAGQYVEGYLIARPMSTRDAIEPLRAAYWFDGAESEGVVKFKMRGSDAVAAIPEADLGATEQQEPNSEPFVVSRANEQELPYQVDVHYYRQGNEYEEGVQSERVMNTDSTALHSVDLAMVLADVKARDVAAVTLYTSRLERTGFQFTTSRKYAHLEPMDVVTVTYGGTLYTARITDKDEAAGVVQFKAVAEDSSLYAAIGAPGYASGFYTAVNSGTVGGVPTDTNDPAASIPATASTYARFLDLPPLLVSHVGLGIYVSVTPNRANTGDTWEGALDYYSLDGGGAFNEGSLFDTEAVVCQCTTTLGNYSGGDTVDLINTLSLEVAGELSSTTFDGFAAGQNALLVGSEIINFQTATLIGTASNGINKNYRISKLLRGRRGTEQHIGAHAASEICILLDTRLLRFTEPETRLGATIYRVASFGEDVDDLSSQTVTNSGVCLKPFSPANLRGAKSAAANWDINLTWDRRDRLYDGQITDAASAPLSEDSETYELEIWNTGLTTLKRTVTGLSASSYAYSNADQVTDFGSTQSAIGLKVYQISATVGRGFAASSVVTAA